MEKKKVLIILFLLLVTLTACSQSSVGALTQSSEDMTGMLTFNPDPIDSMTPVTLSLQLTDSSGQAIDDAQVSYDLTMPAMSMPPNQPQATSQGNGLYTAQTTFSMSGEWQAAVTIVQGGNTTTLTFDFKVK
jgi:nitrogen fixation protein FixH